MRISPEEENNENVLRRGEMRVFLEEEKIDNFLRGE